MNVPAYHITVHGIFVSQRTELMESKDHVFGNSVSLSLPELLLLIVQQK